MRTSLKVFAIAATLAAATSSAAFARYPCGYGYAPHHGVCYPIHARAYRGAPVYGYSNPVSGAVNGAASGAATGYATAGPVGAAVGTGLGTASGALTGTANMLQGR